MELDEVSACVDSLGLVNFPENMDMQYIGNRVSSMQLDNEAEMADFSDDFGSNFRNIPGANTSESTIEVVELDESAKAFQQFQKEREDTTFSRNCLFCKRHFSGNRSLILNHLTEEHNLFLGQPDNLVYISEFLDILENMLNKLQCLFCEKIFNDWSALKEHMRKKMHKGINPDNKTFDRFYMLNYLNKVQTMDVTGQEADDEGREIEVEPKDNSMICLYCDYRCFDFEEILNHLKVIHDFDFRHLKNQYKLCFYSQVKLINYIRRKVLINECIICDTAFKSKEALSKHMTTSCHMKIFPPREKWDQLEYFFSTLETDYLLCALQDEDASDESDDSNIEIISEDLKIPKTSVLADENLRKELL